MLKTYELTEETKEIKTENGETIILHRIKALTDFKTRRNYLKIKAGDLGGWIQSYDNLTQDGWGWVFGDAMVYGNAWIDDAEVKDNAKIYGNAQVSGESEVKGNAVVCDNAIVYHGNIQDNSVVDGNAKITHAGIRGDSHIGGTAVIHEQTPIYDITLMSGYIGFRYDLYK